MQYKSHALFINYNSGFLNDDAIDLSYQYQYLYFVHNKSTTFLHTTVLYICLFQTRGPYKNNKLNYNYIK